MIAGIRDRDTFVRLRRDGVRLRNGSLWCSYVRDDTMTPPQVAFAISRAVGAAVTRNRLRRRLKAILQPLDVPSGLLLIGAQPAAIELTFDQLHEQVVELIERARRSQLATNGSGRG